MTPTTQEILDGIADLQTAAMPPGWRIILKNTHAEIERLQGALKDTVFATDKVTSDLQEKVLTLEAEVLRLRDFIDRRGLRKEFSAWAEQRGPVQKADKTNG